MEKSTSRRILMGLLCALLLFCAVLDRTGGHLFAAAVVPVLCLCFALTFESRVIPVRVVASQPRSFLTLRSPRAPPSA